MVRESYKNPANGAMEIRPATMVVHRKALMGIFAILAATSVYFSFLTFFHSFQLQPQPIPPNKQSVLQTSRTRPSPRASMSRADLAKIFYTHHQKSIHSLVNESTALFWAPDTVKQPPFLLFKDSLGKPLYRAPWEPKLDYIPGPGLAANKSHFILWRDLCFAAKAFANYRYPSKHVHQKQPPILPHVSILRMNENWGGLSRYVSNRTTANEYWTWQNSEERWKKELGCSQADIEAYLDGPDVQAVVTVQHHYMDHPKVHSIPIGFRAKRDMPLVLDALGQDSQSIIAHDRPQLLMINSNPHSWRAPLLQQVMNNFYGTVQNTYGYKGRGLEKGNPRFLAYLNEMRHSKFILSPPGLGLDCYRHWEAIHMGTFPVIEHLNRTDGWFRTFDDLPVAWIDSYENLTPEFLEEEYDKLLAKAHSYNYKRLTKQYWIEMTRNALKK